MPASQPMVPIKGYRPDIDGLRALAILSVVLFHAGVPGVTGGFTGVDVFFVISGYLIGGHILSEIHDGNFSFARFYQRRAKRILPASYTIFALTILASLFLFSPFEAAHLARAAFASALSASNILFWKTSGYFDSRSELNPLLMTWSLGVEEQFYAFVPLILVFSKRLSRNLFVPIILSLCVLSFALSVYELPRDPSFVFYMLPPRAWELGMGIYLAMLQRNPRFYLNHKEVTSKLHTAVPQLLSFVGLGLLLAPIFLYTAVTVFPGVAALPSVFGTVLLLAAKDSWINRRILSTPLLTSIGKISYSWYLIHWPLLAFARVIYEVKLPAFATTIIIFASLLLAILSYYFIEQPFRRSKTAPVPLLLRYAWITAAILIISGFVWLSHGIQSRVPQLARVEKSSLYTPSDTCLVSYGADKPNLSHDCYDPTANHPGVALWGDSHSAALAPGFRSLTGQQGFSFAQLGKASCLPIVGATRYLPQHPTHAAQCMRFNKAVLNLIEADKNIQFVILAGYWSAPLHRNTEDGWILSDTSLFDSGVTQTTPTLNASVDRLQTSLASTIASLRRAGKKVIVVDDVPVFAIDPLWRVRTADNPVRSALARWLRLGADIDPGYAPMDNQSSVAFTSALLKQVTAQFPDVILLDLKKQLCSNTEQCSYRDGDNLLYIDPQHLSTIGSHLALRSFQFPSL